MLVDECKIVFEQLHKARWEKSSKLMQIEYPKDTWNNIAKEISTEAWETPFRVRATFWRAGEGRYMPLSNSGDYLLEFEKLQHNFWEFNTKGMCIDFAMAWQKPRHALSNIKQLGAAGLVLCALERKRRGLDECILLNDAGRIAECISSNLFVAKDGVVYTPPLSEGALDGVVRRFIIENAQTFGIEVEQKTLLTTDINDADEIFLSNATSGIQWVQKWSQKRYYSNISKKIHKEIRQIFLLS
jgi:branched-chain amino acid aminotransferase